MLGPVWVEGFHVHADAIAPAIEHQQVRVANGVLAAQEKILVREHLVDFGVLLGEIYFAGRAYVGFGGSIGGVAFWAHDGCEGDVHGGAQPAHQRQHFGLLPGLAWPQPAGGIATGEVGENRRGLGEDLAIDHQRRDARSGVDAQVVSAMMVTVFEGDQRGLERDAEFFEHDVGSEGTGSGGVVKFYHNSAFD